MENNTTSSLRSRLARVAVGIGIAAGVFLAPTAAASAAPAATVSASSQTAAAGVDSAADLPPVGNGDWPWFQ